MLDDSSFTVPMEERNKKLRTSKYTPFVAGNTTKEANKISVTVLLAAAGSQNLSVPSIKIIV